MKKKYIICDAVRADSGKSETLLHVITKLGGDSIATKINDKDKSAIIEVDGGKVAVVTLGDPASGHLDYLADVAKEEPDIIVCASRTRGETVGDVMSISTEHNYDVIWFNNFYFNGTSDESQRHILNETSADAVVALVKKLLEQN